MPVTFLKIKNKNSQFQIPQIAFIVEFEVNKFTKQTLYKYLYSLKYISLQHIHSYIGPLTHTSLFRHLSTHTKTLFFALPHFTLILHYFTLTSLILHTNTSLILHLLHTSLYSYFTHSTKWDPLLPIYTSLRVSSTFLYNDKINSSPTF